MNMFVLDNCLNVMIVDVEDYFQVFVFELVFKFFDWLLILLCVEENMYWLLDVFVEYNVKFMFFILGWVVQCCLMFIKCIVEEGYELVSYGLNYCWVIIMICDEFIDDVKISKVILEDVGGVVVKGYCVFSFFVNDDN